MEYEATECGHTRDGLRVDAITESGVTHSGCLKLPVWLYQEIRAIVSKITDLSVFMGMSGMFLTG